MVSGSGLGMRQPNSYCDTYTYTVVLFIFGPLHVGAYKLKNMESVFIVSFPGHSKSWMMEWPGDKAIQYMFKC